MAQSIARDYWVNIHTQGSAWSLRINDLVVYSNGGTGHRSFSYPINTSVREGENTVSFIFAPIKGKNPDNGEYQQGPKEDFWVDISIEAINSQTNEKERLNTLLLRYDMEGGELVSYDTPMGSDTPVHDTEHLYTNGEFYATSPDLLVVDTGEIVEAERVDMDFRISDPIPDFSWKDKATGLQDTPLLRHELRQAYQRIYQLFEDGDTEAILREFGPVWERAGHLMAGGMGAREYIESMPIGSQLVGISQEPDGPRLNDLRLSNKAEEDSLEFMGSGRLVRILPSPLNWSYPNQPNKEGHVMPIIFYRTDAGEWRIAAVDS